MSGRKRTLTPAECNFIILERQPAHTLVDNVRRQAAVIKSLQQRQDELLEEIAELRGLLRAGRLEHKAMMESFKQKRSRLNPMPNGVRHPYPSAAGKPLRRANG